MPCSNAIEGWVCWDGQDLLIPVPGDHFIRFKGNSFVLAFEMVPKLIGFGVCWINGVPAKFAVRWDGT